jgi:two-component system nitrate/nitrite response regulator NarL
MGQTCQRRMSPEIKLYLLAENRLLRDTLTRLLRKRSEILVVGVNRITTTSKEEIASAHCDVLLTDCFDSTTHSAFLSDVLREKPETKLVLFGMNDDPATFLRAAFLGTCGYMLKDASVAEMVAAVLAAVRNEATCPPNLCLSLIQYLQRRGAASPDLANEQASDKKALTPRQLQLIQLVANGLTNKEIASNLNLSEFTVKNHISRVMRRVDAGTRYAAVDIVRAAGHLPLR